MNRPNIVYDPTCKICLSRHNVFLLLNEWMIISVLTANFLLYFSHFLKISSSVADYYWNYWNYDLSFMPRPSLYVTRPAIFVSIAICSLLNEFLRCSENSILWFFCVQNWLFSWMNNVLRGMFYIADFFFHFLADVLTLICDFNSTWFHVLESIPKFQFPEF